MRLSCFKAVSFICLASKFHIINQTVYLCIDYNLITSSISMSGRLCRHLLHRHLHLLMLEILVRP